MRVAVIVPDWELPPSGGRKGLHLVAKTLKSFGEDAFCVGLPYEYEEVGDTVVRGDDFDGGADVLIVPDGWKATQTDYYRGFAKEHRGPIVVYMQNSSMVGPRDDRETHYWGLGPAHNKAVRKNKGIPDSMPIETVYLPVDTSLFAPQKLKVPNLLAYAPARNSGVLEMVARRHEGPTIRLRGLKPADLAFALSLSEIFVLASGCEGQSCILNEAMASECACVTWPSIGLEDFLEHEQNAILAKQDSVVVLEEMTKRLVRNRSMLTAIGKSARTTCLSMFSYGQFTDSLKAAWGKILTDLTK